VPAAAVKVTNVDENTSHALITNDKGGYEVVNLKPGRYRIVANKEGFGAVELSDVTLDARQERRADITLNVASATQSVQVIATASWSIPKTGPFPTPRDLRKSRSCLSITAVPQPVLLPP